MGPSATPETTLHGRALDLLNFFLADMNGAFGPFLGIFLLTQRDWNQEAIGFVAMIGSLAALVFQAPIGAFIDITHAKRAILVASMAVVAIGAIAVAGWPDFAVVIAAIALMGLAGDVFGPAVVAVTRGLCSDAALTRRIGRNSVFDHAGNITIALVAGAVGWSVSQRAVFFLVPVCALLSAAAVLSISPAAIDHARARGLVDGAATFEKRPAAFSVLFEDRRLLTFAACVVLFHFANAPMLPLVGQKLALGDRSAATALMSACIVAAQFVMVPMALLAGTQADRIGRKKLLLAAFAILPLRGMLYTLSDDRLWLVGVQLLDGIGAGLMNVLIPVVLADLTRGTGRYNASQGAVATLQGIAVAASNFVAGAVVYHWGYSAGFLTLAAVASGGLLLVIAGMPETRPALAVVPAPALVDTPPGSA